MNHKTAKYILFILLQSLIYGIGNPLTKFAYETMTPLWLLTVRYAIALLLLFLFFGKRILPCLRRTRWTLWVPPALCCAGAYISINLALNLTSATNVGFIMSLPVLFTPILSVLYLKKRYEFWRLPIQLALVAGLFLLCCNGGGFSFGVGEILSLFSALCLAGILVFGEKAMETMDAISFITPQMAATFLFSFLGALFLEAPAGLTEADGKAWLVVLYLAVICSVGGNLLQTVAVPNLTASTVSMLQCTQPILTAAASFLLLGETLGAVGLTGAGIIVACLLLDGWLSARSIRKTYERYKGDSALKGGK